MRKNKFDQLDESVLRIYLKAISEYLIAEVSGGVEKYIDMFFTKGCIHPLLQRNPQYLDLLIIF